MPGSGVADDATPGVASGRLLDSRPCRGCQYDLQNSAVSGVCPECGKPIRESITRPLLKYSDREHVRRLQRANALVSTGLLIVVLVSMLAAAVMELLDPIEDESTMTMFFMGGGVLTFIGGISIAFGWWLTTTPDPTKEDELVARHRSWLRGFVVVYITTLVLSFIGGVLYNGFLIYSFVFELAVSIVSYFAWIGTFYFGAKYLSGVAVRIPDLKIERQSDSLARTLIFTLAAYVIVAFGMIWTAIAPDQYAVVWLFSASQLLMIVGGVIAGILSLVALVQYARISSRLRKGLKSVVAQMP